ncbi:MAG: EVE domain-containing protein [Rhizobiaceae bacterium]
MTAYWIGVASAEHVRRGRAEGFMQLGHGKEAPLRRLRPGDGIVYYSPTTTFGVKDGLQSFTAIGTEAEAGPYRAEMGDGFRPFRRNVRWAGAWETPIKPLLGGLQFAAGAANWGRKLRFGLLSISEEDFRLIARAMQAKTDPPMAPGGSTEGCRSGR